jgi:hypothetical protein
VWQEFKGESGVMRVRRSVGLWCVGRLIGGAIRAELGGGWRANGVTIHGQKVGSEYGQE